MQESGDSSSLKPSSIADVIEKALEWSYREKERLINFLHKGTTFFSYTGMGIIPANIISNFLRVLTQKSYYNPYDATEVSVHIAPYREDEYGVIHFMTTSWERNETVRLTDALYIMMVPTLYIIPNPEDPVLSQKINPQDMIVVPDEKHSILYETIIASIVGLESSEKLTGKKNQRFARIKDELNTLPLVIEDLYGYYDSIIENIKEKTSEEITILYTPLMKPVVYSIVYKLAMKGTKVSFYPLSMGLVIEPKENNIIIIYTTVEEDLVREARFRFMRKNIPILYLPFRTDPLTAQIYGVILSHFF